MNGFIDMLCANGYIPKYSTVQELQSALIYFQAFYGSLGTRIKLLKNPDARKGLD